MKLFFSGIGKNVVELDERLGSPRYRLFSCHGSYLKYAIKTMPMVGSIDNDYEIMLDSGAFTAWSKGEEVTLKHLIRVYGQLLDKYGHMGKAVWLINLDKIPGSPGKTASNAEIAEAIKISDENFYILREKFGDIVLPVFHQNESSARLLEVCDMADYVCVSPRNDLAEGVRRQWATEVHAELPKGKTTHGLAATGYPMMARVPWGSVDSASWIMLAAYGKIYINGRLNQMAISSDSPTRMHDKEEHYDNLNWQEKMQLEQRMEEWGFTLSKLQEDFVERSIWNRLMMSQLYRTVGDVKISMSETFFDL